MATQIGVDGKRYPTESSPALTRDDVVAREVRAFGSRREGYTLRIINKKAVWVEPTDAAGGGAEISTLIGLSDVDVEGLQDGDSIAWNATAGKWIRTQGVEGPKGDPGVPGPPGSSGPEGPEGPQGVPGPQGVQGPQGDAGPVGPAGLEWQGEWTAARTYAPDDAVGYNGTSYFAVASSTGVVPGTDSTIWAVLAAQGPQGIQGVQGEQGEIGPQGLQGPKGDTGAIGPQGPQGEIGPQGLQGVKGDTGANGTDATISGFTKGFVFHGSDPNVARPPVYGSVEWMGSVIPVNATEYDTRVIIP